MLLSRPAGCRRGRPAGRGVSAAGPLGLHGRLADGALALPVLADLRAEAGVGLGDDVLVLPEQLAVAVQASLRQLAGLHGVEDGAAGLALVGAVVEPAVLGEILDLGEHLAHTGAGVPQADAPQTGGVDEDSPSGQQEQVAGRGGVAALAVDVPGGLDVHDVLAEEGVGEGGLARAGLPEQHRGPAGHDRGEHVEPLAVLRADGEDGHARRGRLDVLHEVRPGRRVRYEVGLGEHHDRLRPGLPRQGEEPFDPGEVQLDGERHGDDRVVDVGGEDLPLGPLGGGGPHERGTARQQRTHVAGLGAVGVDGGPVARADDLHGVAGDDVLGVGADHAVRGGHVTQPPVDPDHAARHQSLRGERGEGVRPLLVPAVGSESVRGGGKRGEVQREPFEGRPRRRAFTDARREVGSAGGHGGGRNGRLDAGTAHHRDSHRSHLPRTSSRTAPVGRPADTAHSRGRGGGPPTIYPAPACRHLRAPVGMGRAAGGVAGGAAGRRLREGHATAQDSPLRAKSVAWVSSVRRAAMKPKATVLSWATVAL
ncbi:hypothetical protein SALBM217S_02771 [Streptomyces griseoloalbus]